VKGNATHGPLSKLRNQSAQDLSISVIKAQDNSSISARAGSDRF
jgi:hypothetical protein